MEVQLTVLPARIKFNSPSRIVNFTFFVLVAVITLFSLNAAGTLAAKPSGGKLAVAIPTDPDTLDPHKFVAAATEEIAFNIFEGLVSFDPDGDIIPGLASNWEVSRDGKVYTFDLRKDVYFHNGHKMTSADVMYSFKRMMDKSTGYPRTWVNDIVKIEAPNDYKFVITLNKVSAPFIADLTDGSVIPEGTGPEQKSKPIGTRPFRYVQWLPGQYLKLAKNEKYWKKGVPYLDEVTFKIIPDLATQMLNLKAGSVQIIPRVTGDSAAEAMKDKKLKIVSGPMNLVQLMAMNLSRKPFNDIRVRQAINYAVNKDEIIDGAAAGFGTKLGSNMSPVMGVYYTNLTDLYKTNINKAKALLKEAGYPKGFKATLSLPAPYDIHVKAGEILAAQLKKVGIDLKIELVEWGTWLDRIYTNRDYDLTVIGFTGKLDPHLVLSRYESSYERNFFNFKNPEFDALIRKGEKTTAKAERKKIYEQCQKILAENAVAVYIMDPSMISAMSENVDGWKIYAKYVADFSKVQLKDKK